MSSALFEQKRNEDGAVAVWCVQLYFPPFEDKAEKFFFWTTAAGGVDLDDGNFYEYGLTNVRGRHQRDRGNDYAEFTIANPFNERYQSIYPYEELIEKGEVTIYEAYEIEDGYCVSEQRFFGYLKDFTLDDNEKTMPFTSYSDMSRIGFLVGGRILTRERCGTEFNYNGINSPIIHPCGWTLEQGGNPIFCSHFRAGIDGCESHNNEHRFYAVEGLSTATVEIVSNDVPVTGFDYNTGACFSENVYFLLPDWSVLPMNEGKKDMEILGFDLFDNDRLKPAVILDAFVHEVDRLDIATFDKGVLETRREHLFYIGGRKFKPVGALGAELVHGITYKKRFDKAKLKSCVPSVEKAFVYNLHTSLGTYLVTDKNKRYFWKVHNRKADFQNYEIYYNQGYNLIY